ncbi:MAG TPA: MBOAT family protein, partial [Erysipelotrichaceae bacterium]|nr:MBOAT family protein [Erysipelotrichaceae bacterium]
MSYFSPFYLVMVPLLMAIYQLASRKARPVILLLASYMFIWFASNKLIIYILLATLGIHYFGMWLDDLEKE